MIQGEYRRNDGRFIVQEYQLGPEDFEDMLIALRKDNEDFEKSDQITRGYELEFWRRMSLKHQFMFSEDNPGIITNHCGYFYAVPLSIFDFDTLKMADEIECEIITPKSIRMDEPLIRLAQPIFEQINEFGDQKAHFMDCKAKSSEISLELSIDGELIFLWINRSDLMNLKTSLSGTISLAPMEAMILAYRLTALVQSILRRHGGGEDYEQ